MMITATRRLTPTKRQSLRRELGWALSAARAPRIRSRVEFAESEIVLPEGPFKGQRWRRTHQPYAYHLLHLHDTLPHRKSAVTGCVQSGKTLNEVVINCLWHLFERRERVGYGLTSMDMAKDKWRLELLPVIEASPRLRRFLPTGGGGSKGGTPTLIQFTNGAALRFISAHGRDDKRSAVTVDALVKTEVDRYDTAGEVSREASPADQMDQRAAAQGDLAWIYEECTCTIPQGRIQQLLLASTGTRLAVYCRACRNWVTPEREHLVGWEGAADVLEARELGSFICPACRVMWTEAERQWMLDRMIALHRGQEVERDRRTGQLRVVGTPPRTDRFGFRWSAFFNRFWTTEYLVAAEWRTLRAADPVDAEKEARQMRWALPAEPPEIDLTGLSLTVMESRVAGRRGEAPPATRWTSCGVDCNSRRLDVVVWAWTESDGVVAGQVIETAEVDVRAKELGVKAGLLAALRALRDDVILAGWPTPDASLVRPQWTLIDLGWEEDVVWEFLRESAAAGIKGLAGVLGRGQSEPPGSGAYNHPDQLSEKVLWIGEQCHIRQSSRRVAAWGAAGIATPPTFVMANSDHWKSWLHDGFGTPPGQAGALTTYQPSTAADHRALAEFRRHVMAERRVRKFVPRRGAVDVWDDSSRQPNHKLDAAYYGCVAAHLAGVRVVTPRPTAPAKRPPPPPILANVSR